MIQTHSDSAFKKEETIGHTLKCTIVTLVGSSASTEPMNAHLLDFPSKRVRHVNRSTCSAKLFELCDSIDHRLLSEQALHEVVGRLSTRCRISIERGLRLRHPHQHLYGC